ncbi:MAG: hypothetical protein Q9169_003320 [Polycauliona sp. 2 TL-2023]
MSSTQLPTRIYGGVTVPSTPLITSALAYSKAHSTPTLHNHMLRSWLFGFIMADKLPHLLTRDREVHSIAAILHDVGFDPSGALVSEDKCFEVDGAKAAVAFIEQETEKGKGKGGDKDGEWDVHRKQLLWDAIALHAVIHISLHKEPAVVATTLGIGADLMGPSSPLTRGLLSQEEYDGVVNAVRDWV